MGTVGAGVGGEICRVGGVLRRQTRDGGDVWRMVLGQAVGGGVRREVRGLRGGVDGVRRERRIGPVLLDQAGLAGVLERVLDVLVLWCRETLVVRIGVVLKKRRVSGRRVRQGDC